MTGELTEQLSKHEVLTYADMGKAALIELPKVRIPFFAESVFRECIEAGITPVVAHPERNTELRNDPKKLIDWVKNGVCAQLTALSLTGRFGEEIEKVCHKWIEHGCVHIVASDAHRPSGRSPDLAPAFHLIEKQYSSELAQLLFVDNPQQLLKGEALSGAEEIQRAGQPQEDPVMASKSAFF